MHLTAAYYSPSAGRTVGRWVRRLRLAATSTDRATCGYALDSCLLITACGAGCSR